MSSLERSQPFASHNARCIVELPSQRRGSSVADEDVRRRASCAPTVRRRASCESYVYSRTSNAATRPPPSRMIERTGGARGEPPCGATCSARPEPGTASCRTPSCELLEGVLGQPSPCRSASPSTLPMVETRSAAAGSALGARASSRASVKPPSTRWLAPQHSLELSECVLATLPNRERALPAGRHSLLRGHSVAATRQWRWAHHVYDEDGPWRIQEGCSSQTGAVLASGREARGRNIWGSDATGTSVFSWERMLLSSL